MDVSSQFTTHTRRFIMGRSKRPAKVSYKDLVARGHQKLPVLWQAQPRPAWTFQVGDKVRRTPSHAGYPVSDEIGTVEQILPPEGVNTLGAVVVRYADKVVGEGRWGNTYPRRTVHCAGNLERVDSV
jgi:hypothetical protein